MRTIIINSPYLARDLLKDGEKIVDIKPHRQIENATVFVFESSDNIMKKIEEKRASKHK